MDLLQLLVSDFAVQVYDFGCILLWLALRVTSLLILTAKICFNLFCSVATASEAVLAFVPICNNGLIGCAIDTGHLFMSHFSDFSSNIRNNISLWETLGVCTWLLLIVCFPKLRKIVSSCLTFMIVAALVLLRKVLTFRKQSTRRDSPKPFTIQSCLVFFLSTSFAITKWFLRLLFTEDNEKREYASSDTDTGLNCVACYERPKSILLMPCKHVCLCVKCANIMMNNRSSRLCPLCRQAINNTMKIYI